MTNLTRSPEEEFEALLDRNNMGVASIMTGNLVRANNILSEALAMIDRREDRTPTTAPMTTRIGVESSQREEDEGDDTNHDGLQKTGGQQQCPPSESPQSQTMRLPSAENAVVDDVQLDRSDFAISSNCMIWPRLTGEEILASLRLKANMDIKLDGIMASSDVLMRFKGGNCDLLSNGEYMRKMGYDDEDWLYIYSIVAFNVALVAAANAFLQENFTYREASLIRAKKFFEASRTILHRAMQHIRQQDYSQQGKSSLSNPHPPPLDALLPTGNPILDVLTAMILAKLSQTNHFLSMHNEARFYSNQFEAYVQLLANNVLSSGPGGTLSPSLSHFYYQTSDRSEANEVWELQAKCCRRLYMEISHLMRSNMPAPSA